MADYAVIYFIVSIIVLITISRYKDGLKPETILIAFCLGILAAPVAGTVSYYLKKTLISNAQSSLGFSWNNFLLFFLSSDL